MRTCTGLALVIAMTGCSLYGEGGADPGVDAGAPAVEQGFYVANLTCQSAECSSPLVSMDRANVSERDGVVSIEWSRNGDPGPSHRHSGNMSIDGSGCADMNSGFDALVEHSAYRLCRNLGVPTGAVALGATVVWGASSWRVDLTRL